MWPANRASTHVRESRGLRVCRAVSRAATRLSPSSDACCGLVLPEPAVLVVRLSSRSGHFPQTQLKLGSGHFAVTEAVTESWCKLCQRGCETLGRVPRQRALLLRVKVASSAAANGRTHDVDGHMARHPFSRYTLYEIAPKVSASFRTSLFLGLMWGYICDA